MRNARGQMTIEMMLIIIIMLAMGMSLSKFAKRISLAKTFVSGPWKPLQAMIENGVWIAADSKKLHPHHRGRHGSYNADAVAGDGADGDPQ